MEIDFSSLNLQEIFNLEIWLEEVENTELNASPYREFHFDHESLDLRFSGEHRVSIEKGLLTLTTCTTGRRNELHSVSLKIANLTPKESYIVAKPVIVDWRMHCLPDFSVPSLPRLEGLAELENWYETNPKSILVAETGRNLTPTIRWFSLVIEPIEFECKLLCNVTIFAYFKKTREQEPNTNLTQ